MRLPTIYTSPGDRPKFNFLLTENYLSEFRSEVDKARVRQNLGIPDEYNLYWGNIKGNIANLTDIISLITQQTSGTSTQTAQNKIDIATLNSACLGYANSISTLQTSVTNIQSFIDTIADIKTELLDMKTDIAQNAANIASKGSGGSSADLTGYATQSWVNSQGFITSASLSSYATQEWVTQQINNALSADTLTDITITPASISVTINADPVSISIVGTYSKTGTKSIDLSSATVTPSDPTIAKWTNNKIEIVGVGSTTLNVSVGTITKSISVTVSESGQESIPQYIGFGRTYQEAYNASKDSEFTTINDTWTEATIPCGTYESGTELALFIITTQTITGLAEVGSLSIPEPLATNVTLGNQSGYTVYRLPDNGTSFEWVYPISSYSLKVTAQ